MAAESGNVWLVRLRTGAPSGSPAVKAWQTLICLTSNGIEFTANDIDTGSKCDGEYGSSISGTRTWTISGEGNWVDDDGLTTQGSFPVLFATWKSGEIVGAEFYNTTDNSQVIRGNVRISSLSGTAAYNDRTTFSVSFSGVGEPFYGPEA